MFHTNIKNLNKNLDELKITINEIGENLDYVFLSETWKLESTETYGMKGYDMIYNQDEIKQNDGMVVYIRNGIEFTYNIVTLGEINMIQLRINLSGKKILIFGVYRPPSTERQVFVSELSIFFDNVRMDCDVCALVGDMNLNLFEQNEINDDYLNILSEENFLSAINVEKTRIQNNSKSCIDHLFLRRNGGGMVVLETNITDHYSLYLQIIFSETNKPTSGKRNNEIKKNTVLILIH